MDGAVSRLAVEQLGLHETMMPEILTIVTGTSTILGLLSLLAYLFYSYRIREIEKSERSIKEVAEGEGLFNAEQILQIIREFKDDNVRLNAIKQFANVQQKSGERLYSKIKPNINIVRLQSHDHRVFEKGSLVVGLVFLSLGLIGLLASLFPTMVSVFPTTPSRHPVLTASSSFHIESYRYEVDFTNFAFEDDNSTVTYNGRFYEPSEWRR
jgi:hypothetical protein